MRRSKKSLNNKKISEYLNKGVAFVMYADFAQIYDRLQDIDYNSFAEYYEKLFKHFNIRPKYILDIGCGSGSITIPLARHGYVVTGIDISEEMLALAAEKAESESLDILFLNQDMTELELIAPADAAICALDGVNYLTNDGDLKRLFFGIAKYLNPDGIFIFDLNSEYKMKHVLDENTFVYDENDAFCVWSSSYDSDDKICSFFLDFFIKAENGLYKRGEEYQEERAYSSAEIKTAAEEAGLELASVYDDRSLDNARPDSERIFYVLKKPSA